MSSLNKDGVAASISSSSLMLHLVLQYKVLLFIRDQPLKGSL